MDERFPLQWHALLDKGLSIVGVVVKQQSNSSHLRYRANGLSIRPDTLHQAHSVRIDPLGFFRDVVDTVRNLVATPCQVAHFLEKSNDLTVKVYIQLQDITCRTISADDEKTSGNGELVSCDCR